MLEKIKIGLIGTGRIGKLHGENIAYAIPEVKLEAVADIFMNEQTKKWAKTLSVSKCYKDASKIFEDKNIDAVFICSSTNTHADYIMQAAKAQKHIFCEKPIDLDLNKIKIAVDAVERANVKFQVGFVRRFDHNHKKVRDTVASGMLGKPHIVKITSRDPEPPPMEYVNSSGGIFIDMMIHDFDMARYLCGSDVTEVMTYGAVRIDSQFAQYDDVDTAIVMLKFENGAIGVIDNSRAARYGYDQRTEVHCDKGCVQVSNDLNDTARISTSDGVICSKPTWFFLERYNNAFIAQTKDFVKAVIEDTQPPVTGIDGIMPVAIAMAAKKSLDEGRPVKISEII